MRERSRAARIVGVGAVLLALGGGCKASTDRAAMDQAARLTGGDPRLGPAKLRSYGCNTCHTIPGVVGADAQVGPPLTGIAGRMYIAGILTNTPQHLVEWIRDPTKVDPHTAMPDVGVSERDARDIAAYLYTLDR
jgi:cytochrome c